MAHPRPASAPQTPQRRPSIPHPPLPPSPLPLPLPPPSASGSVSPNPRRASLPPSAATTPPPSKTRARDLLRKHYGLGVGPPPPLSGKAKADDPMDFDSVAFDAKAYYEQLITTSSLTTLLKRENELLEEIRQLDSERQALVYNHHHELIAASATITNMKTRAEGLDADLDLLKVAFSEISRLGTEVAIDNAKTGEAAR